MHGACNVAVIIFENEPGYPKKAANVSHNTTNKCESCYSPAPLVMDE